MPEYQEGTLRVHGIGDVPVEDIQVFLSNISHCYNSICVFEFSIIQIAEDARFTKEFIPDRLFRYRWMEPFFASRGYTRSLLTDYSIPLRDIVPPGRHLVLQAVSLQSPGFWDFLGKLNPLEVIRLYLNDRHERRKDHEYRESAEREKLNLENELLKNQVFEGRLNLLRDLGVTDEELAPLKNRFIHAPLDSLGLVQDRKLINAAEIVHKPQRPKK